MPLTDRTKEYESAYQTLGPAGWHDTVHELWRYQSQQVAQYFSLPWYRRWFAKKPWESPTWGQL